MLDLAGIVFSSVMMFFVIFRAVQLDRVTPWFVKLEREPEPEHQDASAAAHDRSWRRRG